MSRISTDDLLDDLANTIDLLRNRDLHMAQIDRMAELAYEAERHAIETFQKWQETHTPDEIPELA